MFILKVLLIASLLGQVETPRSNYAPESSDPVLSPCLIKLKSQNEIRIPAQEAGVLIEMPVKEGTRVKRGELLAKVDDRDALANLKITEYALDSANKKAEEDIEVRYAQAAEAVAEVDLMQDQKANLAQPGAVPDIEIRRKKLDLRRSRLQIEKAQKDQVLAGLEAKVKEAERDAAETALERRTILAPFDGEVVDTYRHRSEWVNPGDPILKLARFDELHVEGTAYAHKFDRAELQGKKVTVTVERARGRKMSFEGQVVHVDPIVRSDGSYVVRAKVKNEREAGSWLIQPGLRASMTIHME